MAKNDLLTVSLKEHRHFIPPKPAVFSDAFERPFLSEDTGVELVDATRSLPIKRRPILHRETLAHGLQVISLHAEHNTLHDFTR